MADYLTGLVNRAIGTTPAVRPRVPTMFEPVPFESIGETAPAPFAVGEVHRAEPSRQQEEQFKSRHDEGAPDAAVPRRHLPDSSTVADPPPEQPNASPAAPPSALSAEPPQVPAAAGLGRAARERDVVHQEAQPEPTRATRPAVTEQRTTPAPLVTPATEADRELSPSVRTPMQPQAVPLADEAPALPTALAPPATQARPRDGSGKAEPGALRPKTRQVDPLDVSVAARSIRRATPPSSQTLVHVSIGRVEVHAPASRPQPESKRERAKPKPPTALDDYLGHRNGTRR